MMKRQSILACSALVLLASCARPSPLPPEEVLRQAVLAGGQLQSSSFAVDIDVRSLAPQLKGSATVRLNGVLQDGGHASRFTVNADGAMTQGGQAFTGNVTAEVASDRNKDLYVRLDSLSLTPPHPFLSQESLTTYLGKWLRYPQEGDSNVVPLSPDPSLLRAQSEVIRVTRDRGVQRMGEFDAYHYDVEIDPEKFAVFLTRLSEEEGGDAGSIAKELESYDARGQLWIDANSFVVRQISWVISPRAGSDAPLELKINVVLRNHNAAPPVEFPQDAEVLTGLTIFGAPASIPKP